MVIFFSLIVKKHLLWEWKESQRRTHMPKAELTTRIIKRDLIRICQSVTFIWGFPCGASNKKPDCQCRSGKRYGFIPGWGRFPEEGNGHPLQYSYLENPMDRGAWWVMVHRVSKSHTQPWYEFGSYLMSHTGCFFLNILFSLLTLFFRSALSLICNYWIFSIDVYLFLSKYLSNSLPTRQDITSLWTIITVVSIFGSVYNPEQFKTQSQHTIIYLSLHVLGTGSK